MTGRTAGEPSSGSYFVPVAEDGPRSTYLATQHTSGAWSEAEQHISPLTGLVVHAIDRFTAVRAEETGRADDKAISRLTFDILGVVAITEVRIEVSVVRPGRTVELVEAVVTSGGRTVLVGRAWRLARTDTRSVAGGAPSPVPGAEQLPVWDARTVWAGGYIDSLEARRAADSAPGRTTAWLRTSVALVEGQDPSPLARYVALVDTANGLAVRQPPEEWLFPNVDLTIHLHRLPVLGAVGLDTTVVFGADGVGLTSTVLHDERGPIGRASQSLTLRPRRIPAPPV